MMSARVGVAAAVAAALMLPGCAAVPATPGAQLSTSDGSRTSDASRTSAGHGLPTGTWTKDGPISAALLQGTLTAGHDGCVYVSVSGGTGTATPANPDDGYWLMVWPAGFTAVGSFEEGLMVVDPDGREVARTGDDVNLQGGSGDRSFPGTERCTDHPSSLRFLGGPGQGLPDSSPVRTSTT